MEREIKSGKGAATKRYSMSPCQKSDSVGTDFVGCITITGNPVSPHNHRVNSPPAITDAAMLSQIRVTGIPACDSSKVVILAPEAVDGFHLHKH